MDPLSPYWTTRYPKYTNRYPKCPCLFRRLICAKNRCGDFFMLLIFRKYMSKFDWFTIWSRNMKSCGSATIMLVWFVIVERIKLWYAWNFLIRHITKSDIFLFYFQLLKGMVNVKLALLIQPIRIFISLTFFLSFSLFCLGFTKFLIVT